MRLIKRNRFAPPNPVKTDIRKGTPDVVDIYPGDDFSKILTNYKGDLDVNLHGPGRMFNEDITYAPIIISLSEDTNQKIRIKGINNPIINKAIRIQSYTSSILKDSLHLNCYFLIENVIFETTYADYQLRLECRGITIKNCFFIRGTVG